MRRRGSRLIILELLTGAHGLYVLPKMIALQIHHNDVPLCVAGASDLGVLNAIVNAVGVLGADSISRRNDAEEEPHFFLTVGGLTSRKEPPNEHLRWLENTQLAIGDCIKITMLDCDKVDLPVNHYESVRRDPDDERNEFEEAKQTYLRLRDKYESSLGIDDEQKKEGEQAATRNH
jgi:hypothetical protein